MRDWIETPFRDTLRMRHAVTIPSLWGTELKLQSNPYQKTACSHNSLAMRDWIETFGCYLFLNLFKVTIPSLWGTELKRPHTDTRTHQLSVTIPSLWGTELKRWFRSLLKPRLDLSSHNSLAMRDWIETLKMPIGKPRLPWSHNSLAMRDWIETPRLPQLRQKLLRHNSLAMRDWIETGWS